MAKQEASLNLLQNYLPPGTFETVSRSLHQYKVHLTVTKERKSILGDYRHRTHNANHRISVNSNLNRYAFLITLLHELAHLLTFEQYNNRVMAHGKEWKMIDGQLLHSFIASKLFPADIERELMISLRNPAASSCAEDGLLRVLRKYDDKESHYRLVEEIPLNAMFRCPDGRVFKKLEKLRKRFKCMEMKTGRIYLFSPVYEITEV